MTSPATSVRRLLGEAARGNTLTPAQQRRQAALRPFLPSFHWVTFALMLSVVMTVAWSVEAAHWTDTPPLYLAAFIGYAAGVVLAKQRINVLVLQSVGFTLWLLTLVWMFIQFLHFPFGLTGIHLLGEHLGLWLRAAGSGGISTDAVPFAAALVVLTWLVGYAAGWFMFRKDNVWLPVVVAGLALLSNLSFLPDRFWYYFYWYVILAMLTLAWAGFLDRRTSWERRRIDNSMSLAAFSMSDALLFGLAALIIAATLPGSFARPVFLKRANDFLQWPQQHLAGDLSRLFAGVSTKKPLPYRLFDDTLAFQGAIMLGEQVMFVADSSYPTYFHVRSYPTYVSQGWSAGKTQLVPVDWQYGETPQALYKERQPVVQKITLQYGALQLPVGGLVEESDRRLLAEVPVPPAYAIALGDAPQQGKLPEEVQAIAVKLRGLVPPPGPELSTPVGVSKGPTDIQLIQAIPAGFELVSILHDGNGKATVASVRQKLLPGAEALSIQSPSRLATNDSYIVRTSVSIAKPEELRAAGEDYPMWVKEMYLQLPDALPRRVRDLADALTAGAATPYEKALAVRAYLKTIPYSQNIPPPGYNSDGVDHFLFIAKSGYSEYFGSAMAVLLRAAGVPARLSVGYLYGEQASDGTVLERDLNAHGWAEVYFPTYGWVDFEPTPGLDSPTDAMLAAADVLEFPLGPDATDLEGDEGFLPPVGLVNEGNDADQGGFKLGLPSRGWLILAAVLAAVVLLLRWGMRWLLGTPRRAVEVYGKLARLADFAGVGPVQGQTALEFGGRLGRAEPDMLPAVAVVVRAYSAGTYGQKNMTLEQEQEVGKAWRQVRLALLRKALGRIIWLGRRRLPEA